MWGGRQAVEVDGGGGGGRSWREGRGVEMQEERCEREAVL